MLPFVLHGMEQVLLLRRNNKSLKGAYLDLRRMKYARNLGFYVP
jgi:hypothetical protein